MSPGANFRAYLAGLPSAAGAADRMWRDADGQPVGRVYQTNLTSAFQPIVRIADGATVAWDALIRTYGGGQTPLQPWNLFALAASEGELIELDRLCRVLHTLGYFSRIESGEPLHVKVHERLLRGVDEHHGQTFRRILDRLGIGRDRVVIELSHTVAGNYRLMGAVTTNYRLNGFAVALNFGRRDAAALESLLKECSFDILKAWAPAPVAQAEAGVAQLAELVRRRRMSLVYTRVESARQLHLLAAAGAGLVQGLAVGAPASRPLRGCIAGTAEGVAA